MPIERKSRLARTYVRVGERFDAHELARVRVYLGSSPPCLVIDFSKVTHFEDAAVSTLAEELRLAPGPTSLRGLPEARFRRLRSPPA